jgi:hypothetical protein
MVGRCLFTVCGLLAPMFASATDPSPYVRIEQAQPTTRKAFEISGTKSDAAAFVPLNEDRRVRWIVKDINLIDGKLSELKKSQPTYLSTLQIQALFDARNLAVVQADESLKDATVYSFPALQERKLKGWISTIDSEMTKVGYGPREHVKAVISYAGMEPAAVTLHYRTYAQRQANEENWSTYTVPKTMKVGTYEFRVTPTRKGAQAKPCLENVLVFNDPTEQSICGGYRP